MDHFILEDVCQDILIDNPPEKLLKVNYVGIDLKPGSILTPRQVKDKPEVSFDADPNAYYTLVFEDLDAPSRQDHHLRNCRHWLVVNIPGGDVSRGEEVIGYAGSGPPEGTGYHRYVFLVYQQSGQQKYDLPVIAYNKIEGRLKQNVPDLVAKLGLQKLVAGNYYKAEYDDYVPILRKSFTT